MDYGSLVQAGISLYSDWQAGKLTQQQFDLLKKQLADQAAIPVPQLEKIVAQHRGPSAMGAIPEDAGLRAQQMQSLGGLQDIIDHGGMTLDDKVAQEAAQSSSNAADRQRRAGIAADLQSRGQLNSGADLVMQQSSAQDAANRDRASGQESAASAQRRKLQALDDLSRTAGSVRGQDFAERSAKASAQDSIDAWNAGSAEKAQYYNAGLAQQNFQNQMAKVTGQAGAVNNLAAQYGNEAQGVRNQGAAIGQAAGHAVNSYGSGSGGGTYNWGELQDEAGNRGGYTDLSKDDEK